MAERMPRVTGAAVVRALERAGWYRDRQRGSHVHLRHVHLPGAVTVPVHAGATIPPSILRSILLQAGMTVEEFKTRL